MRWSFLCGLNASSLVSMRYLPFSSACWGLWQETQFISKIGLTSVTKSTGLAAAAPTRTKPDAKAPSAQHLINLMFKALKMNNAQTKVNPMWNVGNGEL